MAMDADDHEVAEDTPGAHRHDHTHADATPRGTHAAHIHWHLHLDDREADAKRNGHAHPVGHEQLPWEANER